MKRKYTTPIIEMINNVMEDCFMLPASESGHTDEALSRGLWDDDPSGGNSSPARSQRFDLWEE